MSRRFILGAALVVALPIPGYALAHERHTHKVMGTVTTLHENHLDVKATDGKRRTITLNQKTKIVRGKAKVKLDDIKIGERVVVTAMETKGKDGKTTMVATEVRLGATSSSGPYDRRRQVRYSGLKRARDISAVCDAIREDMAPLNRLRMP
jgi:hypothetical protein